MSDIGWTIIPCTGDSGAAYQARVIGRVPGRPTPTDVRGAGPCRYVADLGDDGARRAAERDGWATGLAPEPGYAPLTVRPAPPAPPSRPVLAVALPAVITPAALPPVITPAALPPVAAEPAPEPAPAPAPRKRITPTPRKVR